MNTPQTDVVQRKADDSDAPALVPLVDITEDEAGITVVADLPGAERETLSIRV